MKQFLHKILIFFIIPVVFILIFDNWLRNQNSAYKEKYCAVLKDKDSIEVLILGNSHACYGVDPNSFFQYAYNLANVNQSLYFDKRITLTLLDKLANLKYVFISIDYHSLYFSDQGLRNIWSYYGNGVKYKDTDYSLSVISPFLFGYTPKFAISMLKKTISNKLKYKDTKILDFDVEEGVDISKPMRKGFLDFEGVNESAFGEKFYTARARAFNNVVKESNENVEILTDLEDFIKILVCNDIVPILFTPPTFHDYNDYLDYNFIKKNNADIQKICAKYDLEYFDFMDSPLFSKDDFNSCDHLNRQGAKKFGRLLDKIIR